MAAYKAFREPGLITDPLAISNQDFNDFDNRRLRYAIYWSFFENNAYRSIHSWSERYKTEYGLYRYIRHIYNPAYRLGEFWKAHLMGGSLDQAAGSSGALPIETENEALRPVISQIWQWSNWQINKDVFTLYGSLFGDVGLRVVDDVGRAKIYLQVVHPGIIKEVEKDPFGNVKAYVIQEKRGDPTGGSQMVEYTETAERDGEAVVYTTYLNGTPYAWPPFEAAKWSEPYGFVPLVVVQHNNVGLEWGWSELHPAREKIHEVDDLASKLHDQIRKMVDTPWLFSGVTKPGATPAMSYTSLTGQQAVDRPQPGREEIPALYGPAGATSTPLVAPLDIAATAAEIKEVIGELERDYPELKVDILRASGDVSGRALRIAQQPAEDKVKQRRANYDDALVRAQQMAAAIGGFRGYFSGVGLDSYADGLLDHSIDDRPVFSEDPLDKVEIDKTFWETAGAAIKAGIPLEVYLVEHGWDEARLERLLQSEEYQNRQALARLALGGEQARLIREGATNA